MTLFIMRKRGTEKNKGKGENKGQGGSWYLFLISLFITPFGPSTYYASTLCKHHARHWWVRLALLLTPSAQCHGWGDQPSCSWRNAMLSNTQFEYLLRTQAHSYKTIYLCACVHVCQCVCIHKCPCECESQRSLSSGIFHFVCSQGLLLSQSSLRRVGWLASKSQGASSFCIYGAEITDLHHHAYFFFFLNGFWSSNSQHCACKSSTLLAELFPQLQSK